MTKYPSQHRQGLDYMYKALGAKPLPLRKLVDASLMSEAATKEMLDLARRAGVLTLDVTGETTLFGRSARIKRTAFRDAIVGCWFEENVPCTNIQAVKAFAGFMSKSQLYYSVARLGDMLKIDRDGTRVPVYSLNEVEV